MAKILRKSEEIHEALLPEFSFLLAKNRNFVIIAFNMLKMELKFEYTRLMTKVYFILASLLQQQ